MKCLCSAVALVLLFALPAQAQQLNLQINDGRVTLDATNVPARQILAEWARIGGTKVVGAEKITGSPLTLKLVDMPERQALDIILRNVAGFMAAPRQASAVPGASTYDRILIMATSSVVPPQPAGRNAAAPNFGGQANETQRRVPASSNSRCSRSPRRGQRVPRSGPATTARIRCSCPCPTAALAPPRQARLR